MSNYIMIRAAVSMTWHSSDGIFTVKGMASRAPCKNPEGMPSTKTERKVVLVVIAIVFRGRDGISNAKWHFEDCHD